MQKHTREEKKTRTKLNFKQMKTVAQMWHFQMHFSLSLVDCERLLFSANLLFMTNCKFSFTDTKRVHIAARIRITMWSANSSMPNAMPVPRFMFIPNIFRNFILISMRLESSFPIAYAHLHHMGGKQEPYIQKYNAVARENKQINMNMHMNSSYIYHICICLNSQSNQLELDSNDVALNYVDWVKQFCYYNFHWILLFFY